MRSPFGSILVCSCSPVAMSEGVGVGVPVGSEVTIGRTVSRSAALAYQSHPPGAPPRPGNEPRAAGHGRIVAGCAFPDESTTSMPNTRAVAVPNCTTPAVPRST
jgi:hypothetical protein